MFSQLKKERKKERQEKIWLSFDVIGLNHSIIAICRR